MIAECEADLARSRTREGMAVAKAKGRLRGKKPKLSPHQEAHLVDCTAPGDIPPPNSLNFQRRSIYRLPCHPPRLKRTVRDRLTTPRCLSRCMSCLGTMPRAGHALLAVSTQ